MRDLRGEKIYILYIAYVKKLTSQKLILRPKQSVVLPYFELFTIPQIVYVLNEGFARSENLHSLYSVC